MMSTLRAFVLFRWALIVSVSLFSAGFLVAQQSDTTEVRPGDVANNAPVNPQLNQILTAWENKTKTYKELSGTHRRFVYDSVFEVEKRADGKFYYKAPDKGRIEIEEVEIGPNQVSQKLGKTGKPYALKSDIPEIWICDGKKIAQAQVDGKTFQVFDLPEEHQGRNIMDGPLPFLFGLPAQVAKARYHITVLPQTNEKFVWLKILPKRQIDAVNWSEAEVILDRNTYLPFAVKLIDPNGNKETVFRFENLKTNRNVIIDFIQGDPFEIARVLKDYKEIKNGNQNAEGVARTRPPQNRPVGPQPQAADVSQVPVEQVQPKSVTMPDVSNYPWKTLKKFFESKGYKIEFRNAGAAPKPEMKFAVAGQNPKAGEPLHDGQTVTVWLYDEVKTAGNQ